jgi:hypothetical protein
MSGMRERAPRGGRVLPTPSPVAAASPSGGALAHGAPTCDECGGNDLALTLVPSVAGRTITPSDAS